MSKASKCIASLALLLSASSCQLADNGTGIPPTQLTEAFLDSTHTYTVPDPSSPSPSEPASATPPPIEDTTLADLLAACRLPPSGGTPTRFEPCDRLTVSEDGKYLAYFFGLGGCGRGISIVDLKNDRTSYRIPEGGIDFEFLANGKVLITTGYCEGGQFSLLDPATSELKDLGSWGKWRRWNSSGTAFVVVTHPYHGFESAVWGYNVPEDLMLLQQPDNWQMDDHPLWTHDGTHLLLQHRAIVTENGTYHFPSARQIIRVEVATGTQTILLHDPRFDFDLCQGSSSDCDTWHGDWVQIRRFPFEPRTIEYSLDAPTLPEATCLMYGMNCTTEPTLFALNWRTGDLIPWDENALPTPIPRVVPPREPGSG